MSKKRIIQGPCNDCGRKTDHLVLKVHKTCGSEVCDQTDPSGRVWWETVFEMIECCGCHFISLKRTFTFSEYDGPEIEYFPPPVSRRRPSWHGELLMSLPADSALPGLLDEVYAALHGSNRRLAAMGARALLDLAIVNSVGDVGTFRQKLDALVTRGYTSPRQREFLDAALEAGHAATHRGHCPKAEDLNLVMDIVESVLQQVYVLPHVAADLKKRTPPRSKPAE